MTDKERIVEILKNYTKKHGIMASVVILEEYAEELVNNGAIVPPCKVGDKIYFIDACETAEDFGKEYVSWGEVLQLTFNRFGEWVLTDKRLLGMGEVFLTKEEAEAKLKEMEQ